MRQWVQTRYAIACTILPFKATDKKKAIILITAFAPRGAWEQQSSVDPRSSIKSRNAAMNKQTNKKDQFIRMKDKRTQHRNEKKTPGRTSEYSLLVRVQLLVRGSSVDDSESFGLSKQKHSSANAALVLSRHLQHVKAPLCGQTCAWEKSKSALAA